MIHLKTFGVATVLLATWNATSSTPLPTRPAPHFLARREMEILHYPQITSMAANRRSAKSAANLAHKASIHGCHDQSMAATPRSPDAFLI